MTQVLLGTTSVHTTAAACDYLADRLTADDTLIVLTVDESDIETRDAGDAANVARTRLLEPTIETLTREGDPATVIEDVADERAVDTIVVGPTRGNPDVAGQPPGSTVQALLADPVCPVAVVPV